MYPQTLVQSKCFNTSRDVHIGSDHMPQDTSLLDVEWMEGSGDTLSKPSGGPRAELLPSESSYGLRKANTVRGKRTSIAISKRKSFGSLLAAGRQVTEEVLTLEGDDPERGDYPWRDAADVYAAKYMDMFSPVKQHIDNENLDPDRSMKLESEPPATLHEHSSAVELQRPPSGLETEKRIAKPTRRDSRMADRSRPGTRRGSHTAIRATYTAWRSGRDEEKVLADVRRTAVPGRPTRGFALFAPYMDRKVMVAGTGSVEPDRLGKQASTSSRVKTSDRSGQNVWSDVVSSPPIPTHTHSKEASMDVSRKGHKNVSFQAPSVMEDKDDSIVQGQPQSIPSISEPSISLPQAKDPNDRAREQQTPNIQSSIGPLRRNLHMGSRFPGEGSPHGFKIHEDTSELTRTTHCPIGYERRLTRKQLRKHL